MKKVFVFLMIVMSMMVVSSCSSEQSQPEMKGERFEYEGHTYITFKEYTGEYTYFRMGTVHDPDCPCQSK